VVKVVNRDLQKVFPERANPCVAVGHRNDTLLNDRKQNGKSVLCVQFITLIRSVRISPLRGGNGLAFPGHFS